MSLSWLSASGPDLLRLLALPAFAWVALEDIRTRRVPQWVWMPLVGLALVALAWEGRRAAAAGNPVWAVEFLVPAAVSIGIVVPIAYLFWWLGLFGGADGKALLVIAVLFPTVPAYTVGATTVPLVVPPTGAFAFTILVNAVLVGVVVPIALAATNALRGQFGRRMFVAYPIPVEQTVQKPGWLLEPGGGLFDKVDLDAVRMYLRWRNLSLETLRADPDQYRDPASLPAEPNPPTDGRVTLETDGGEVEDPWGVEAFLADIEGSAYGTPPEELRRGLETLAETEEVWVSPGLPFLVLVFGGLLLGLAYGDPVAVFLG